MTSRNLCFKLMKEDLKRRVWTIAWSVLSTFFGLIVPVALKCGDYKERIADGLDEPARLRAMENLAVMLYSNYFYMFLLVGVSAVLWAVSGYHYLHNSRKTDFYHSLPVKRHQLFLASCLNGILVPLICYLVGELVAAAMAAQAGIGPAVYGSQLWTGMFLNMAYYCLAYATVIVAMMMTGNVVVALLGASVFYGYGPAVAWLIEGYFSVWFRTYYYASIVKLIDRLAKYTSPAANYIFALNDFAENQWQPYRGFLVLLAAAALTVLAYGLYRLRPSEAAGRAMAFSKTKAPIRLLLTVPVSVVAGIFFYELRGNGAQSDSLGWLIFGAVCGSVLMHCLMEIIYHFDFRKLFSHRIQLAGCTVFCLILSLAGYFDWYGYDRWLPDGAKVESAVLEDYHDNWVSQGQPELNDSSSYDTSNQFYYWSYDVGYEFDHMELTDLYPVLEIARKGAETVANERNQTRTAGDFSEWTTCVMKFRMKNGREVYRRYNVPLDSHMQEMFASVHDSMEYKLGKYPVMSQTAEDTAEVYFQQYNQVRNVDLDAQETARLLEAFQQDMADLNIGIRKQELPIATIQFRTKAMAEAIEFNRRTGTNWYDRISDRCYYPVFPSFARTLGFLTEHGIQPEELGAEMLEKLQIRFDGSSYDRAASGESEVIELVEPEDIAELAPGLLYQDYLSMNSAYERDTASGVDVYAIRKGQGTGNGTEYEDSAYLPFQINLNRLSPETIEKYGFMDDER